jgi:carbamoyltransferase
VGGEKRIKIKINKIKIKINMANISFYGSHNSAVAIEENNKLICVIEVERFISQKNAGYAQYKISRTRPHLLLEIMDYIKETYGISEFENCIFSNSDTIEDEHMVKMCPVDITIRKNGDNSFTQGYEKLIRAKNYYSILHHESHAACGFYQTNYETALIFSFDGGGSDGFFNIYHAENRKTIKKIGSHNMDLGFPYMVIAQYLNDIRFENSLDNGVLIYPGKIMGLCSYGNLNKKWLPHFENFYKSKPDGPTYAGMIKKLGDDIGIEFSITNRIEGQISWDIAKTSQIAFENVFFELTKEYIEKYPKIPIILVGGCALNILLNTRMYNTYTKKKLLFNGDRRDVFIPPNPNDCGIAVGMLLNHVKPEKAIDVTYSGIRILDKHTLMTCAEERNHNLVNIEEIVSDLIDGKIIGVVRDTSEHGPRALGNRSILCNPTYPEMKDILNKKVKDREWYRPFAPVVRLEDVSKYFEFNGESRWMQFCPEVKKKWRKKLSSITHVDNTARVQTVTREQNQWLYDLLTEFDKKTGIGVLLNTSFNVNGKPILSKYSEAFEVFDKTDMDRLLLQNIYFKK